MTLNSVVKRIRTIAEAHGQVQTFESGTLLNDFLANKETKYPAILLQNTGGQISVTNKTTTVSFRIFFLDQVHLSEDARDNELDVQSDMVSIAQDFISKMNDPNYTDWRVSKENLINLLADHTEDYLAGCYMDFSIQIIFTLNTCQVP